MKFKYTSNFKWRMIFILIIFQGNNGFSQMFSSSNDSHSAANITTIWEDENAALNNSAGIINDYNLTAIVNVINVNGFAGLNRYSAALTKKFRNDNAFSVSVKYFGDSDLNEQYYGISYARKVMKNWNIGIQADLVGYSSANFGRIFTPTFEIGTILKASKNLSVGFHVFNPLNQSLNDNLYLYSLFQIGAKYQLSEKVAIMSEVEKASTLQFNFKSALEYEIIENLKLRGGFQTSNSQFHFGLSYGFGKFGLGGSNSVNPQLGSSFGAGFSFKK